jgi:hypothetical protein
MATLGQVGELVTTQLRERVDRLASAIEDDSLDFAEVTRLADTVEGFAETISEIYGDLEQTLMRGLHHAGSEDEDEDSRQTEEPEGEQQRQQPENDSPAEEVTKVELLERAREVNVHGRSAMSKEELAQAVEAEENLTKEELLERARQAGIEGRSSMAKDELRKALHDTGA